MHYQIGIAWIIGLQMHSIVVLAVHAGMHHEDAGLDCGAVTRLEYHRTDG